jgi:hypothetical protein
MMEDNDSFFNDVFGCENEFDLLSKKAKVSSL